jgi:hypothetical protein
MKKKEKEALLESFPDMFMEAIKVNNHLSHNLDTNGGILSLMVYGSSSAVLLNGNSDLLKVALVAYAARNPEFLEMLKQVSEFINDEENFKEYQKNY